MDTLRILLLAFLWAFVFTPAFGQALNVTSGSMVLQPFAGGPFTLAGPGFSASGGFETDGQSPLNDLFSPGEAPPLRFYADTEIPSLDISLTVHGVPWSLPVGSVAGLPGVAIAQFDVTPGLVLMGPGTYSTTFFFSGSFNGAPQSVVSANPGAGCDQGGPGTVTCTDFGLSGGGIVKFDVVPNQESAAILNISQASFTFSAPTPSTVSLLLLGLVALGFRAWARTRGQRVT